MEVNEQFVALLQRHGGQFRKNGRIHMPCPDCGSYNERKEKFSASPDGRFNCLVCGFGGAGIDDITPFLKGVVNADPAPWKGELVERPKRIPAWTKWTRKDYEAKYCASPRDIARAWGKYKALPYDVIKSRGLGLGVLPCSKCRHPRLVLPVFNEQGGVSNLRGRQIDCDCDMKWTASGGWTADNLSPYNLLEMPDGVEWGAVWIGENPVDALRVNIANETMWGVAAYSASYWYDRWALALLAKGGARPIYMVAMDNDLVGNGGGKRRAEFMKQWMEDKGLKREPKFVPSGIKIANSLLHWSANANPENSEEEYAVWLKFRGQKAMVRLLEYPPSLPVKADLGDFLDMESD